MTKDIINENSQVGEIVAKDFRTAALFREAGIDFCCGGKKKLAEACKEKNVDLQTIREGIQRLEQMPISNAQNFMEWDLDFLCDYIQNTHHKFVLKALPDLLFYTNKIASVHGEHHPELREVASVFQKINEELLQHLKKEEEVLFPAIKEMIKHPSSIMKELIHSEITRMANEHEFAGGAMDSINQMTNGYSVPADGCNTYNLTFKLLSQFEDDLHVHVHLENNILYPKALLLKA